MTDPGAAKRPIGLREGLRRLSTGLIAYGTIGVVVTVIGLLAFVWSLGRLNGAADQIDGTIRDLATTVHRTADTLTDAAGTADSVGGTLDSTAATVAQAATTVGAMGPTLDALEASFRDFGILGQHPLAPAADVVATLSTNISGLDQRLAAVSASLTADHDALAANQASLAALGTSLDAVAVRLESGNIQSTISDIRTVLTVVLLMFVVWSAIPAVGALMFGLWLRREVRRGGATPAARHGCAPPAPGPEDAPTTTTPAELRSTSPTRRSAAGRCPSVPWPRYARSPAGTSSISRMPIGCISAGPRSDGESPASLRYASDVHIKSAAHSGWRIVHEVRPADWPRSAHRGAVPRLGQVVSQRRPRGMEARSSRGRRRPAAPTTSTGTAPSPRRYGSSDGHGRNTSWRMSWMPPLMSPPTSFASYASDWAGERVARARIRSRNPGAKRSTWASIRSVMSTVDPRARGSTPTRPPCRPARGSGSHGAYCTSSTYGRSGCRPAATSASDAATSSIVPPRWSVAARRDPSAAHGTGPSSAQSTLKTPGP